MANPNDETLLNLVDDDINERKEFVPPPVDLEGADKEEGPNILEEIDIFGIKAPGSMREIGKKVEIPKQVPLTGKGAMAPKPPPCSCFMFFFCMFKKFFVIKDGSYEELNMNPLPPGMRTINAINQYEGVVKTAQSKINETREKAQTADPDYNVVDYPDELYWTMKKTEACVKQTLMDSIFYRFFANGFEFSMFFWMRFYLKELKKPEDRSIGYLIAMACGAVVSMFMAGLCRERANFFVGATKAKAGQCLRSLLYKKLATADFMFLLNADSGLITRFANFEPAGVLQFLGNYGEMYTSPVFILGTFIYILTELKLWGLFIIIALSLCLATLNKLNTMQVVRWRAFNSQGNARAIALRELIPNIEEIKKAGQEDFFHKKLNARRGGEMGALKSLHNLSNILGFTFELTFLMGAFMIVVFTQLASEGEFQIGLAFSNIALVNNLRGPFKAMMDLVVNYSEYSLSRVSMH
jgi:hypothetical protein